MAGFWALLGLFFKIGVGESSSSGRGLIVARDAGMATSMAPAQKYKHGRARFLASTIVLGRGQRGWNNGD